MQQRRRFEQVISLQDRIIEWVNDVRTEATAMPPGPDRETLLKKVLQAETAMHLDEWAKSSAMQSSK